MTTWIEKRVEALEARLAETEKRLRALTATELILSGAGSPQGVVEAVQGTHYWDITNQVEYINVSIVGTPPQGTDWEVLCTDCAGLIDGTGKPTQIAYWTGVSTIGGDDGLTVDAANDRIGAGAATPDRNLHAEAVDAATNTVTYTSRDSHTTSGAAAALFGVGHEDELEDDAGNMQVASEQVTLWSSATSGTESPLLRFATYPSGTIGPGYAAIWGGTAINAAGRTVIPNGAGDVTRVLWVNWAVFESGGGVSTGAGQCVPGANIVLYNDGTDSFVLTINVDGSVAVSRSGGATTASIQLWLLWI